MNFILRTLIALPVLGTVAGCGLFPPTLVDQGIVKVDIQKTRPISVSTATVYRDDGQTVVRGEARFPPWVRHGIFRGHVDVELLLPDGEIVSQHDIRLTPRNRSGEHGRKATFISRFDIEPPRVTTALIQYHNGTH